MYFEVDKISEELGIDLGIPELNGGTFCPEDIVECLDKTLSDISIKGEDFVHFHDVITSKFDEDTLSPFKPIPDETEYFEKLKEDDMKEDPRTLMADYGLGGTGTDEVRFGKLLPIQATDSGGDTGVKPQFSFDANPATGGLCLGPDPSSILQTITMSNSSDGINLEQLETG